MILQRYFFRGFLVLFLGAMVACSSSPKVKRNKYAQLRQQETLEHEFPKVWKAIEETVRKWKVAERDPEEVNEVEMKRIDQRSLETDWIYSQSQDKFIEYEVNGFPRKKYLQTRLKYEILAKKVIGGTNVAIELEEQVERLDKNGNPDGYDEIDGDDVDSARVNQLLGTIKNNVLSMP